MSCIAGPNAIENGLVACLDAGSTKSYPGSGTTWTDISGGGNSGTLSSITYTGTPAYMGFAVASSSGISLGQKLNYTSESFTISLWMYLTSYTTNVVGQSPIPFYKGAYQTSGYYCQITAAGRANFATNQAGVVQITFGNPGTISLNTWFNLAVTRSGAAAKIYVNGADTTLTPATHINPASSTDNFTIGYYGQTGAQIYADMRVANFTTYSRALSADELLQNFHALRGRFGV